MCGELEQGGEVLLHRAELHVARGVREGLCVRDVVGEGGVGGGMLHGRSFRRVCGSSVAQSVRKFTHLVSTVVVIRKTAG